MSDPQGSAIYEDAAGINGNGKLSTEEPENCQLLQEYKIGHDIPMLIRSSEKVELWPNADINEASKPFIDQAGKRYHQGWLAPYIERDLSTALRSSEKVELWLRAHFSNYQTRACFHEKDIPSAEQSEKPNTVQSVITSLAAVEISS